MSTATCATHPASLTAPARIPADLPLNVPLAPRDIYAQKRQEDQMGKIFTLPAGWQSIRPFSSQDHGLARTQAGEIREFYLDLVKTERGMAIQMTHFNHEEVERQRAPLLNKADVQDVLKLMNPS